MTRDDKPDGESEGLSVETPAVRVEASQQTVRRFLDLAAKHSGTAWPWLVYALAFALVLISAGAAWRLATR